MIAPFFLNTAPNKKKKRRAGGAYDWAAADCHARGARDGQRADVPGADHIRHGLPDPHVEAAQAKAAPQAVAVIGSVTVLSCCRG